MNPHDYSMAINLDDMVKEKEREALELLIIKSIHDFLIRRKKDSRGLSY